jgi:hypothetical protein
MVQRDRIIKDARYGEPYWMAVITVETQTLGSNLGEAR